MTYDGFGPALTPYLVLIVVGVLPNGIWRMLAAVIARRLDENAVWLVWVRAVANVLIAGVVGKLVFSPAGALIAVPLPARILALGAALGAFVLFRKSLLAAVLTGEAAIIGAAFIFGR